MSNFSTADKCLQVIRASEDVEGIRSNNRRKILDAVNCVPPLDESTARDMGVEVNVNWGELKVLISHAVTQLLSATIQNQYFFTVKLKGAPDEYASTWESFITEEINTTMRESLQYFELQRSRCTSTATYGVGPQLWLIDDHWLPKFKPLVDLRIATDTTIDFANISWFATRVPYTVFDLVKEVFNDHPNNHWDKEAIATILDSYKEINVTDATNNYNWVSDPEKFAEYIKQNGNFYGGDASPVINLWHFYFKDQDDEGQDGWYMRVMPERDNVKGANDQNFLWTSEDRVARKWEHIIHCQYGDLSAEAPAKFNAIRSLGQLLLEPTFYTNLTLCRMLQHVHDNFNVWLQVTDPANKARAQIQEFGNYKVVREGVRIIPPSERHQIEADLVEMALSKLKQLQVEGSASYTQQSDTGTQKEQTAFETKVKMEQVNAMMSGILMVWFQYEAASYREICRRFCLKDSSDPDIVKFRQRCVAFGIQPQWLDVEHWKVEPVTPLGMGNPTIAQAEADQLMAIRPLLNPQAQNEIVHQKILVVTKDWRKANRWAPLTGKPMQSDASREAIGLFGTLFTGVPVPLTQSNMVDQIDALLPLLAGKVVQITKRDNMATPDEAIGLQNISTYISQAIQSLGQDPQMKEKVKNYGDGLGKINNEIKALIQRGQQSRQQEQDQNGNGANAEIQSKLKSNEILAQAKARASDVKTAQSLHHSDMKFKAQEQRDNAKIYAQIEHERFKAMAGAHNNRLKSIHTTTE